MSAVYRYEVPVDGKVHIHKLTSDPTSVGLRQEGVVEFWSVHHDNAEEHERFFTVVGTGHPLPGNVDLVWGHAYDGFIDPGVGRLTGGSLVWHLVEVIPS